MTRNSGCKMNEHKVILKDLGKYLKKKKGIETYIHQNLLSKLYKLYITGLGYSFSIYNNHICSFYTDELIVSLADPQYKEKFMKHLKRLYRRNERWGNII